MLCPEVEGLADWASKRASLGGCPEEEAGASWELCVLAKGWCGVFAKGVDLVPWET